MFSEFYAKQKLIEAFDPLEDVLPPVELLDDILNHIKPFFFASLHDEAKVLKQEYLNFHSKKNSEDVNVAFIKGFNKLITDTSEYKSLLAKSKILVLDIDDDIWEPWIINTIQVLQNDKSLWKLLIDKPVKGFVNAFFNNPHTNKMTIRLNNVVYGENSNILINPFKIENGDIDINIKDITRSNLRKSIKIITQTHDDLANTIWNQFLVLPLTTALAEYTKDVCSSIFKNESPEFFNNTSSKLLNSIKDFVQKNSEINISDIKVILINSKIFRKAFPDDKNLLKAEILDKLYRDQELNHIIPPINDVQKLLNEF